jgi:segregation and condensation protein B
MNTTQLKHIVEAALLAAGRPLSIDQLRNMFSEDADPPERQGIRDAILALQDDYADRGIALVEVASGYRIQVENSMTEWLSKLWEERPPRYSRALMETLAIIVYRQPITRGDIEEVRGVSVSTNIMRTLLERNWVRVVGHRDVPGKPALFATTREFLDYFGLKVLDDLPALSELQDVDHLKVQLAFDGEGDIGSDVAPGAPHPLVRTAGADERPIEPATVSSLDDARVAADATGAHEVGTAEAGATVIPLKTI